MSYGCLQNEAAQQRADIANHNSRGQAARLAPSHRARAPYLPRVRRRVRGASAGPRGVRLRGLPSRGSRLTFHRGGRLAVSDRKGFTKPQGEHRCIRNSAGPARQ